MVQAPNGGRGRLARLYRSLPGRTEVALAILSAILVVLSFPNFDLAILAWLGLVPLLYALAFRPVTGFGAFVLGWLFGVGYFVGTVYWLTYAMIHYGGIPTPVAYLLLFLAGAVFGPFTGAFSWLLRRAVIRWGALAIWLAPVLWVAVVDWMRFVITGQLWNALGYSQAFHPYVIQAARFGGVYAVSGLILAVNTLVMFWLGTRKLNLIGFGLSVLVVLVFAWSLLLNPDPRSIQDVVPPDRAAADVVVIQPNVPMEPVKSPAEADELMRRHLSLSETQLAGLTDPATPRLVIWPESPMSFAYSTDTLLRTDLADFTKRNRTALLINSMETAPNDGSYNSAVLIGAEGGLAGQYDKIYLLPFGEYMPIPGWVPGVELIPPIVGNFSVGQHYPLLPVGNGKAGVMICFESAVPSLARRYSRDGADLIIEISNDGYLGPTPVQRQHLTNGIFRAVENGRPVVRATNTGITALVTAHGDVIEPTGGFVPDARRWRIDRADTPPTFYARFGDVLAIGCGVITLLIFGLTFLGLRRKPVSE